MNIEETCKVVQGLANYDAMVPVHRAEFDKALDRFAQSMTVAFLSRLDEALYRDNSSSLYNPTGQVANFMDELCDEHKIAFVPGEGFQPRKKDNQE